METKKFGSSTVYNGNTLDVYDKWERPDCIMSDGAYGVSGFEGDTHDHSNIAEWYEPHVEAWSRLAKCSTTLWFWNSEIGWAATHGLLERHGWKYMNVNVWDKGVGHIAGNVNTKTIKRFPVTTEVCVQYVREPMIGDERAKSWLLKEWKRTGMSTKEANVACGVSSAATRKYLTQDDLWYIPEDKLLLLIDYANRHGSDCGKPYFSLDGSKTITLEDWRKIHTYFKCPHGWTNVWSVGGVRGQERLKNGTKALHPNQKPKELMRLLIDASTREGDVVWEPFGGTFTASVVAEEMGRRSYSAELSKEYYEAGCSRFEV